MAKSPVFSLFLLLPCFLSICSGADTDPTINQDPSLWRLPRTLIPTHYRIQLTSILDETPGYSRFTAPGKVWITLNCTESTSVIIFHQVDLDIDTGNITVRDSQGRSIPIQSFSSVIAFEFYIISLGEVLTPGESYVVYIPYTAPISQTRLDGIYLDSYTDLVTNETKYVSTTLFAATSARRAFPCLDEPDLKAVFEIQLGRHGKYHGLSNMDLVNTTNLEEIPGYSLDSFAPTLPMSTYLVCMIVSDLAYEEAVPSDPQQGPVHRVYATPQFIERGGGRYSANLSLTVLEQFGRYYDMEFPLRKLDNVALPQFFFNAMENWGLMTYADRALIYFPGETPARQRYQLSLTVSHEVAHNLFGNMVTCRWWTWIWLNEGWATFVSHQGLHMTYPELRPWQMFVTEVYQLAMSVDESVATHPMANEPLTPEDVGGIYDRIAYEKGASIIRMLQDIVGEPILQEGVRRYLRRYQYQNTEQDNLFEAIQEVVDTQTPPVLPQGATVKGIMDSWTTQAGYPLISLERLESGEILLQQNQYVRNGVTSGNETWWVKVEVQVLTGANPGRRVAWMSDTQRNTTLNMGLDELFFINPESIGYYRVGYSTKMFKEFGHKLIQNHEIFTPVMRAKLLDDAFNFALSGYLPLQNALDITQFMHKESDFLVWRSFGKYMKKVVNALGRRSETGTLFAKFVLDKIVQAKQTSLGKSHLLSEHEMMYLQEELEELEHFLMVSKRQSINIDIDVVKKKIDEFLNHPEEDPDMKKIGWIWRHEESRILGLEEIGRSMSASAYEKSPRKMKPLLKLLEELCSFGNSREELEKIASLYRLIVKQEDLLTLTSCAEKVHRNIFIKDKFARPLKEWVIRNA